MAMLHQHFPWRGLVDLYTDAGSSRLKPHLPILGAPWRSLPRWTFLLMADWRILPFTCSRSWSNDLAQSAPCRHKSSKHRRFPHSPSSPDWCVLEAVVLNGPLFVDGFITTPGGLWLEASFNSHLRNKIVRQQYTRCCLTIFKWWKPVCSKFASIH